MDIETTKLSVLQKIIGVSTLSLLEKINDLLDREMIVGYTTSGEPLTAESFNSRLEKAERQLEIGEYVSQEDLEEEVKGW